MNENLKVVEKFDGRPISITDIATWALPTGHELPPPKFLVQLPALQRGSVWSAEQVEALWDSLVRGFPIGCLILCEPAARLGQQSFAMQKKNQPRVEAKNPDYLLLDGQQRCSAIALGLLNPWTCPVHSAEVVLWVDLEAPDRTDKRDHIFRLLTLSHPWGYQRQNPGSRLSVGLRREAMSEFERSAISLGLNELTFRPGFLPLRCAWPHDARAPLPVAPILNSLARFPKDMADEDIWHEIASEILPMLQQHFDWIAPASNEKAGESIEKGARLRALLQNPTPHMIQLLVGFRRLLDPSDAGLRIPAQLLPREHVNGNANLAISSEREDPIATLFIRINTSGTRPSDEELSYSILKSIMPECREAIEQLSNKFMPAARMVLLLATLVLGREKDMPPVFPDVSRFRRLVQGLDDKIDNFADLLRNLLESGEAERIVKIAHCLLVLDNSGERDFRLLPLQAARIAQSDGYAFLLLLAWIRARKGRSDDDWCGLDEDGHRRLVGAISALSWFPFKRDEANKKNYLGRLWRRVGEMHKVGSLRCLLEPGRFNEIPIIPLPPHKILESAIESCVTGRGFEGYSTALWTKWTFWDDFESDLQKIEAAKAWYARPSILNWDKKDNETIELHNECWWLFVQNTKHNRDLVLYGQRKALARWFPSFDPTSPSQLQDTEQPWDYDHIHPQNYCQGLHDMPPLIKAWHNTIGNIRAWPSEINRGQGDISPPKKLWQPNDQEIVNYKLENAKELRFASGITDKNQIGYWLQSYPAGEDYVPANYLANGHPDSHARWQPHRKSLVRAITSRWVCLYREWYDELKIKDLFWP